MNLLLTLALLQAPHAEMDVGAGRIVGGWEYIWAGYALSFVSLVLYALSLWARRPRASDLSPPAKS